MAAESVDATPVSGRFIEFRCGSWVGGSCSDRRRSASSRSPAGVMVNPRHPAKARSSTAHTRLEAAVLAGQPTDHLDPTAGLTERALD